MESPQPWLIAEWAWPTAERLLRDALADGLRQAEAPPPQSTLQLSLGSCLG